MRFVVALGLALLLGANAIAQEPKNDQALIDALHKLDVRVFKPESADAKLRNDTLKRLRDDVNRKDLEAWRNIKTRADWEKFRDERIAKLRASLGKFPQTPPSVKVVTTKKISGDGCAIENIIYESRPGLYVTANLYVPEKTDKPMPGFILVHSHHNPKTQGELQDMGMIWARQGCLVLVPDMLGHGERRQHPFVNAKSFPEKFATDRQDYWFRYNNALQLHLIGDSLMGWMVWDLMRGIDVLYQRPNIDQSKIMVFGSVAGGGDPCAVLAALDQRVTAAAPFNFGGPQPETKLPAGVDPELSFNYMGGASWESTRNLRLTGRDGFMPWVIVGAIAPRGLIYGHEFFWDVKNDPVWVRFNKIWGDFYAAPDKLIGTTGRGSVKGKKPESTHCNNIGFEHRKEFYPTLTKWFGLPVPEENKKRLDSSELQCWTDDAKKTLQPRKVHELALAAVVKSTGAAQPKDWLRLLGLNDKSLSPKVYNTEAFDDRLLTNGVRIKSQIIRHDIGPGLALPAVVLYPAAVKNPPIVIAIAQDGKAGFLKHRAETIAQLLANGVAVCLPDLRGTGETRSAGEGRGRTSGATSVSAAEWMHGRTVAGTQLRELVLLINELPKQGFRSVALWGDSFVEPNDPKVPFAVPYDAEKLPRQSEPMGGLLAQLGGLFGGDQVKAIYVRGGLVSFQALLDSPHLYCPHDAIIPGVLTVGDMDSLDAANATQNLRLEALVDGFNRSADVKALAVARRSARLEASSPAEVAAWLSSSGPVKK